MLLARAISALLLTIATVIVLLTVAALLLARAISALLLTVAAVVVSVVLLTVAALLTRNVTALLTVAALLTGLIAALFILSLFAGTIGLIAIVHRLIVILMIVVGARLVTALLTTGLIGSVALHLMILISTFFRRSIAVSVIDFFKTCG